MDQPAYARPALLFITVLAAVLYTWGIDHSQYHTFYTNAVRSMTESWKAFFFGSFDPGNSITLDKLPGFLWPQALSARIFGFHPWALTLPQVIEGVASLLVLHRLVRRWAGVNAALIADTAFLVTPVAVGLFRTAVEDPAFTLCVLLAAEAAQRAARDGRLRPLVACGVWVGVGFQAKMLEAWAVLPALALIYLVTAPVTLRRRLAHLGVAAVVMTAVSVSWMLAVTLTPAKDRPYVDGTTNNSAFSMVVGYNFLNRFSSLGISAASTGSVSATQGGGGGHAGGDGSTYRGFGASSGSGSHANRRLGTGGAQSPQSTRRQSSGQFTGAQAAAARQSGGAGGFSGGDQNGWSKMFGTSLASQTGWLYPIAAVSVVCGLLWRRGRPRTDGVRGGFLMWGTWLATYFLVFSAGSVGGHTYYMGVVAVPLAALTGGGVVQMWRAHRAGGRRAWVLPGAVAATAAWSAYLAGQFPSFLPWLAPLVGVLGLAAIALLAPARPARAPSGGRLALAGLAAALAAVLVAPGAWAVQVFDPTYRSTGMGAVGPSGTGRGHGSVTSASGRRGQVLWGDGTARAGAATAADGRGGESRGGVGGVGGFGGMDAGGELTASQRTLLRYTTAHQGSAEYVFATTGWNSASPYILATGARVLPLGGFSGRVPFPTEARFRQLVASGKLHYVLVGGGRGMGAFFGGGGGTSASTATTQITNLVQSTCTRVPASAYGGTDGGGTDVADTSGATATATALYRCGTGR
ncbi:glycosyltransferase family 39 protein [Streptomyces sp. NPDC048277]|uniref:ArnT family glycosyltransferase n=1 Tax=Streptomyces sp. NPDC048277 TaxID=3155027 RepID=UPI0033CEC816